jgi:hypothetical protein
MDSKAEETTANKLNQMDSPEDLDVFVKELMENMVSCFHLISLEFGVFKSSANAVHTRLDLQLPRWRGMY